MSFAADLQAVLDRAKDKAVDVVRKTAYDLDKGMVDRAPVDTGRLKSNFQIGIGTINKATDASPGSDPLPAAAAALATWKPGQTIWLTNSMPYARVAEFGLYGNPPARPTARRPAAAIHRRLSAASCASRCRTSSKSSAKPPGR